LNPFYAVLRQTTEFKRLGLMSIAVPEPVYPVLPLNERLPELLVTPESTVDAPPLAAHIE
jgi:hypothetical protein